MTKRVSVTSLASCLMLFSLSAQSSIKVTGLPLDAYDAGDTIHLHTQSSDIPVTINVSFPEEVVSYDVFEVINGVKSNSLLHVEENKTSFSYKSTLIATSSKEIQYIVSYTSSNGTTGELKSSLIKSWTAPEIVSYPIVSSYYYSGNTSTISANVKEGFASGWSILWDNESGNETKDGTQIQSQYTFTTENSGSSVIDESVTLSILNQAGTSTWLSENRQYSYKIAPVPVVDNNGKTIVRYALSGSSVQLDNIVSGGFPTTWKYSWNDGTDTKDMYIYIFYGLL